MQVAKVGGTKVLLNNWFIVLMFGFCLVGMSIKVLMVFSAVLWHELAHAITALALGFKVREFELLPFGGVARIDRLTEAGSTCEMMIAAAGPLASLVMAAFLYMLFMNNYLNNEYIEFYYKTNLMLAVFNLIPALPLDGGRILRSWLSIYFDFVKATVVAVNFSKVISAGFIISLVYQYIDSSTCNLTFIVAAVFLYTSSKAEIKLAGFRNMRILAYKKAELTARGVMATTHYTAVNSAVIRDIIRLFRPEQYYILLVVDNEFRLCGTLTETEIWETLPQKGLFAKVGDFI